MTTTLDRCRFGAVAATAMSLVAVFLVAGGSAATAATDIGNTCQGSVKVPRNTALMPVPSAASPLPVTPEQQGVITRVTFNVPELGQATTLRTTLKTMRSAGDADRYSVVGESPTLVVADGTHSFTLRVPVSSGERLGVWSDSFIYLCETETNTDVVKFIGREVHPGETVTLLTASRLAVPLVATVEPDADGDGYGHETQDACPSSATTHRPCPRIALDATASAGRRAVSVLVAVSDPTRVAVTGRASVRGDRVRLRGGVRPVRPGLLGRFALRYPKRLQAAVSALPAGRAITVRVRVRTADRLGRVTTDTTKVRITRPGANGSRRLGPHLRDGAGP